MAFAFCVFQDICIKPTALKRLRFSDGKHPPRTARVRTSRGGGLILGRFPIPGEQLMQPGGRVLGDAGEHIGKPGARVYVVELGRGDQRVHCRGALAAAVGPGE